ncbi:hypothetical protein WS68_06685 [Burkholderia sp. TSV86]|nr:hypothetical protein WS68_06685 [Burkholderia sp. TSV86]
MAAWMRSVQDASDANLRFDSAWPAAKRCRMVESQVRWNHMDVFTLADVALAGLSKWGGKYINGEKRAAWAAHVVRGVSLPRCLTRGAEKV